jgi:hypothetical protein
MAERRATKRRECDICIRYRIRVALVVTVGLFALSKGDVTVIPKLLELLHEDSTSYSKQSKEGREDTEKEILENP